MKKTYGQQLAFNFHSTDKGRWIFPEDITLEEVLYASQHDRALYKVMATQWRKSQEMKQKRLIFL